MQVQQAAVEVGQSAPILLVEDEGDQALLIQQTLEDADSPPDVRVVSSGEAAIDYLAGAGKFADRNAHPFPFLVLLDMKMPGIGGFGVLRWLQQNPDLIEHLNVVILSSVTSSKEIEVAYELGAVFYWSKADSSKLQERVRLLRETWQGSTGCADLH